MATGWTTEGSEFESRWGQKFSLLYVTQTGSGVHRASYQMGTGALSPGVKRQGREFFIWYSGGWSPIGSTRHCGHQ
jgi:hypothetical protein